MLTQQQPHYDSFLQLAEAGLDWKGFVPRDWARAIPDRPIDTLPNRHLSRRELRDYCRKSETSDEDAFIACMAWGGMNRRHGRAA